MTIAKLGQTRRMLLKSFENVTDEQFNQKPSAEKWSISQVVYHLYTTEKETAELILNSLKMASEKVEERDISFLKDRSKNVNASKEPSTNFITKTEGMEL